MGVHSRGFGSRVRTSQVADDEVVSWREHANELFSRAERNSDARGHWSGPLANSLLHPQC